MHTYIYIYVYIYLLQEVYGTEKPRLSISGWYHGPVPPKGSDLASLNQIMTKGDDARPFVPILYKGAYMYVKDMCIHGVTYML
jgi:hypothetical protein